MYTGVNPHLIFHSFMKEMPFDPKTIWNMIVILYKKSHLSFYGRKKKKKEAATVGKDHVNCQTR